MVNCSLFCSDAFIVPESVNQLKVGRLPGDDVNINWLLEQGYQILLKLTSWQRARRLSAQVSTWFADPKIAERAVGWVEQPLEFARATRQLLLRTPKQDGTWSYALLVSSLSEAQTFRLAQRVLPAQPSRAEQALATLHAYDRRGGGLETQNKNDKQGLALTQRNKRKFVAQEMLVLLAQLAHNFVIWARNDLAVADPRFNKYGIHRTVRDAFQIPGTITLDAAGGIQQITLNERHPLTAAVKTVFAHNFDFRQRTREA